jgi:16S rRNA (guanine(966)-N(2))-methyltransferase RsmD
MRITGGDLRSRRLLTIKSSGLRPATDRLRESMFDILCNLVDFHGTTALDLYAGTGSVGFEAISRGASRVVFVESNHKVAGVLRENASTLGVAGACGIYMMKVENFLKVCTEKFDIVYVDPPYSFNKTTHEIVDRIMERGIVKGSGVLCVEHSRDYSPPPTKLFRQKEFGSTILSFIKLEKK